MSGKWIVEKKEDPDLLGFYWYICSDCNNRWSYGKTEYCPFCGAKKEKKDAE